MRDEWNRMLDYRIVFNLAVRCTESSWHDARLRLDADVPHDVAMVRECVRGHLADGLDLIERDVIAEAIGDAMRGNAPRR